MPISIGHSVNPALQAQLSFKTGQGEYNKWKWQQEQKTQQQMVDNAFRTSQEVRAIQQPYVQAEMQAWTNQQRANTEIAKMKHLDLWKNSPERITSEVQGMVGRMEATQKAAAKGMENAMGQIVPNIQEGEGYTSPDGQKHIGTNPDGQLSGKDAQRAIDREARRWRSLDRHAPDPDQANPVEIVRFNDDMSIALDKRTGQPIGQPFQNQRSKEQDVVRNGGMKMFQDQMTTHKRSEGAALTKAIEANTQTGQEKGWTSAQLDAANEASARSIRKAFKISEPDMRQSVNEFADTFGFARLDGSGAGTPGQRVIPDDPRAGGGRGVITGGGGGAVPGGGAAADQFFRQRRPGQAPSGTTPQGRVIPDDPRIDKRKRADLATTSTRSAIEAVGDAHAKIAEISGDKHSTLTEPLEGYKFANQMIEAIAQFQALPGSGVIEHGALNVTLKRLAKVKQELAPKVSGVYKSIGSGADHEELNRIGIQASGNNGWISKVYEAMKPMRASAQRAASDMPADQKSLAAAWFTRAFQSDKTSGSAGGYAAQPVSAPRFILNADGNPDPGKWDANTVALGKWFSAATQKPGTRSVSGGVERYTPNEYDPNYRPPPGSSGSGAMSTLRKGIEKVGAHFGSAMTSGSIRSADAQYKSIDAGGGGYWLDPEWVEERQRAAGQWIQWLFD